MEISAGGKYVPMMMNSFLRMDFFLWMTLEMTPAAAAKAELDVQAERPRFFPPSRSPLFSLFGA